MTAYSKAIKDLAARYPRPSPPRFDRYMPRLKRLKNFYEDKAPDAPIAQGRMFIGFVNALVYAAETMYKYKRLTEEIAELTKEPK